MSLEVNLPAVVAEVEAVFARYEDALVNNKIDVLDELFWPSPATVRYGAGENLVGHAALLNALDLRLRGAQVVITGSGAGADALVDAARKLPTLNRIISRASDASSLPASHPAREKIAAAPDGAAFVCVGETCSLPVTDPAALMTTLVAAMR